MTRDKKVNRRSSIYQNPMFKNCFSYSSKDGSIFECEDDTFSSANIKILYLHKIWVKISYTNVIHQFARFSKKWVLPRGLYRERSFCALKIFQNGSCGD